MLREIILFFGRGGGGGYGGGCVRVIFLIKKGSRIIRKHDKGTLKGWV